MFLYSEQHPQQGDIAVQQILVFSCQEAKDKFDKEMAYRFKNAWANYAGVDPTYEVTVKNSLSDSDAGAVYKLRGVLDNDDSFIAIIRCGFTGKVIWEDNLRYDSPELALARCFRKLKFDLIGNIDEMIEQCYLKNKENDFAVQGNADQIEKQDQLKDFTFVTIENSNRVTAHFHNKKKAKDLYNLMKSLGLVALKNWLD